MTLRPLLSALIFAGLFFGMTQPASARQMDEMGIAVLRTIDKVSAVTRTFEVPVDKTVKFGSSLFIHLRACRKASPLDQPESAAFLQIWEKKPTDDKSSWVFSGWMFASNPSLSAVDHPVYDVWLIDCKNAATSSKPEDFSSEKVPEGAPVKSAPPEEASPDNKDAPEDKEDGDADDGEEAVTPAPEEH